MSALQFDKVRIAGWGYDLPPEAISSLAIEERLGPVYERIGLHPGRLELMSGIASRRAWAVNTPPSLAATRSGRSALEATAIDRREIGLLVHASVCRDFLEPATASVVHQALELSPSCSYFDLSNACLGVGNAMMLIGQLIESGAIRAGLAVAGENGQGLVEATIRRLLEDPEISRRSIKRDFASLTIGSGGAAVLLAHEDLAPSAPRLLGGEARAATEHNQLCRGGAVGHSDTGVDSMSELDMSTDSEALLHAGVTLAKELWSDFAPRFGFGEHLPDRTLTHQVGRAHTRALYAALGLDESTGFVTYDRLGNVGSVSLPITMALAAEAGFLQSGHRVALLGIGSGLSALMMGAQW